MDNPEKPEFAGWNSYREFAKRVRHQRRYVWDENVKAFVRTVLATLKDRDVTLREGMILFRAQRGIDYVSHRKNQPEEPSGYGALRMKPRQNLAVEGRANAAGVPVLYLGTTEQTVVSEVRPWVGSEVSVAQFELKRSLRALDLSRGHGQSSIGVITFDHLFNEKPLSPERREMAVWIDIDSAFSEPVTKSDEAGEYVPTQILSEVFRDAGYEAIVYKSQFGEKGFNIVVFDPDDAEVINCAPYRVTELNVSFKEIGNRWFRRKKGGKRSTKKSKR